jgi:pimeloyl-ACP methyl ester carboxylesterase
MSAFTRRTHAVAGVRTVVLEAGDGPPLVFFHGAGTFTGFDFALAWAQRFKVYVPFHPGFGESDVDEAVDSVHDYVLHYLDLFDALGLDRLRLAGHSLGGWIAATFAVEHAHRLERLALLSPVGLRVPEAPTVDIFKIPPHELPGYLIANPAVLEKLMAAPPDVDGIVAQYREMTSAARIAWTRAYDPKLPRWLHRVRVPTLILWGRHDRMLPAAQAEVWGRLLPRAQVQVLESCGHGLVIEDEAAVAAVTAFMGG